MVARAVTSRLSPIDGPPISSQDRVTPIRKQTTTRTAMVSTAPGLSEVSMIISPSTSWITNVAISPARNSASRTEFQCRWRSRIRDSSEAVTNMIPAIATLTEV
jgi:hypothetical protein